jgi:hypothetical protein
MLTPADLSIIALPTPLPEASHQQHDLMVQKAQQKLLGDCGQSVKEGVANCRVIGSEGAAIVGRLVLRECLRNFFYLKPTCQQLSF